MQSVQLQQVGASLRLITGRSPWAPELGERMVPMEALAIPLNRLRSPEPFGGGRRECSSGGWPHYLVPRQATFALSSGAPSVHPAPTRPAEIASLRRVGDQQRTVERSSNAGGTTCFSTIGWTPPSESHPSSHPDSASHVQDPAPFLVRGPVGPVRAPSGGGSGPSRTRSGPLGGRLRPEN